MQIGVESKSISIRSMFVQPTPLLPPRLTGPFSNPVAPSFFGILHVQISRSIDNLCELGGLALLLELAVVGIAAANGWNVVSVPEKVAERSSETCHASVICPSPFLPRCPSIFTSPPTTTSYLRRHCQLTFLRSHTEGDREIEDEPTAEHSGNWFDGHCEVEEETVKGCLLEF